MNTNQDLTEILSGPLSVRLPVLCDVIHVKSTRKSVEDIFANPQQQKAQQIRTGNMSWSSVCWKLEHFGVGCWSAGKLEVTTRKRRAVRCGKLNAGGKKLARMVSGGQEESSSTTKRNFEGTRKRHLFLVFARVCSSLSHDIGSSVSARLLIHVSCACVSDLSSTLSSHPSFVSLFHFILLIFYFLFHVDLAGATSLCTSPNEEPGPLVNNAPSHRL